MNEGLMNALARLACAKRTELRQNNMLYPLDSAVLGVVEGEIERPRSAGGKESHESPG